MVWLLIALSAVVVARSWTPCLVPHPDNPNNGLEGADVHYKLTRYFAGKAPPPLEEVFFATQNLTQATQKSLMRDCPGLLVCAFVMVAEARLPVDAKEGADALAKAEELAASLPLDEYEAAAEIWPIQNALASYARAAEDIRRAQQSAHLPSVHIAVCHCRESLDWLVDGRMYLPGTDMASVELFIYEKCGQVIDVGERFSAFSQVSVVPITDGEIRKDECSGYLQHLVDHYKNPADYTVFFQADAGDHLQWGFLALVMRAIGNRALMAPFVHLNHPRLVASLSPCREKVFQLIFDRSPRQMLGSYCCAQFVVSRERILANPIERYQKMLGMLGSPSPDQCHDIPGHSTHCLMFEVYWHVLFGEEDDHPHRAENAALPLFLRIRDIENESYLPPDSLYLRTALEV